MKQYFRCPGFVPEDCYDCGMLNSLPAFQSPDECASFALTEGPKVCCRCNGKDCVLNTPGCQSSSLWQPQVLCSNTRPNCTKAKEECRAVITAQRLSVYTAPCNLSALAHPNTTVSAGDQVRGSAASSFHSLMMKC